MATSQSTSTAQAAQSYKTGSGRVTITESSVTLRAPGGMREETLQRTQIASVEQRTTSFSLFGLGGAKRVTIRTTDGRQLVLRVVKPRDARAILAALLTR